VAILIAGASVAAGRGDPILWAAIGVVAIATAVGVVRARRWAFLIEAIIALVVTLGVAVIALFSLALTTAISAGLDGPMFGTPFGVLNGWASLLLYGLAFATGLWMVRAAASGLREGERP
jgi:hypothetical protein